MLDEEQIKQDIGIESRARAELKRCADLEKQFEQQGLCSIAEVYRIMVYAIKRVLGEQEGNDESIRKD